MFRRLGLFRIGLVGIGRSSPRRLRGLPGVDQLVQLGGACERLARSERLFLVHDFVVFATDEQTALVLAAGNEDAAHRLAAPDSDQLSAVDPVRQAHADRPADRKRPAQRDLSVRQNLSALDTEMDGQRLAIVRTERGVPLDRNSLRRAQQLVETGPVADEHVGQLSPARAAGGVSHEPNRGGAAILDEPRRIRDDPDVVSNRARTCQIVDHHRLTSSMLPKSC